MYIEANKLQVLIFLDRNLDKLNQDHIRNSTKY